MSTSFHARLVNSPFADPALYLRFPYRGQAILFDCGEIHALTTRDLLKIQAVFISHCHIDHTIGLDHLLRNFLVQDRELKLFGPPGFIDQMQHRLAGYTWNLTRDYPLRIRVTEWGQRHHLECSFRAQNSFRQDSLREIPAPAPIYEDAFIRVTALALDHRDIPSMGYRLEEPQHLSIDKEALRHLGYSPGPWLSRLKEAILRNQEESLIEVALENGTSESRCAGALKSNLVRTRPGESLCYITDASPTEENRERILQLAREVDLLVIEACFPHAELERARKRHHLTAHLSGLWAREAGARRLLLFHHSRKFLALPDQLAIEAHTAFCPPK